TFGFHPFWPLPEKPDMGLGRPNREHALTHSYGRGRGLTSSLELLPVGGDRKAASVPARWQRGQTEISPPSGAPHRPEGPGRGCSAAVFRLFAPAAGRTRATKDYAAVRGLPFVDAASRSAAGAGVRGGVHIPLHGNAGRTFTARTRFFRAAEDYPEPARRG